MTTGIYKLHFSDGSFYVGKSLDVNTRFKEHLGELKRGAHFNHKVQAAYDKLGPPEFTILAECSADSLNDLERSNINLDNPKQLNILAGSDKLYGEEAPRHIYFNEDMLAIFLTIASNPKISRKELASHYGVDVSTVHDISAGRGRALMFKNAYPEEYSKLIANKASNTRGKHTVRLTNGNTVVELVTGEYSEFCRKHGIQSSNLSKVINGNRKSTMGWSLVTDE